MTGVRAGSGGTGLAEGSRPASGSSGGPTPPPFVEFGNENVLVELNNVPVGTYTAPFDLSMSPVTDALTTPVPNPILTIAATETVAEADVAPTVVTDALTTPAPNPILQIVATETVAAADVATATVTDDLTTPVPVVADQIAVTETVAPADVATAVVTDALAVTQLPSAIRALNATGYWKLDDAASPPQDSSGNNRDASSTTNVTYRAIAAPDGRSYVTFTGNQKIPVPDNPAWTVTAAGMSFFFAIRLTTFALDRCVLCKGPGGWEVAIESLAAGEIRATTMQSNGTLIKSETTAPISVLNEWAVYCVTISGNTNAASLLIYKDNNVALPTTPLVGAGTIVTNTASVMQLTARSDTSVNGIIGSAAHIAFFDGVLNPTQIQSLMDAAAADGWIP